jgi:hypothetical protein
VGFGADAQVQSPSQGWDGRHGMQAKALVNDGGRDAAEAAPTQRVSLTKVLFQGWGGLHARALDAGQ